MEIASVDLFCGAGGLTAGFERTGLSVVAGVDVDERCRYAYEHNNDAQFVERDVSNFKTSDLEKLYPSDADRVLAGCAPCQPFSTLRSGEETEEAEDWRLLKEFERLVRGIEPEYVVMENVIGIRDEQIQSDFVDTLLRQGYRIDFEEVYCPDYGVPQKRKRFVLLASRLGDVELPEPTHTGDEHPTVRDSIGDGRFTEIEAGEAHPDDRLHQARTLSDTNLERIRQSQPGGTWREWDDELVLDCHKKDSGQSYESVYGRMRWEEPAPTITTQFHNYGSGRFGHPEQDRALSLREGAMLQTFPEDYRFVPEGEEVEFEKISPMIGNAVPVRLAEEVAEQILRHHRKHRDVKSQRI